MTGKKVSILGKRGSIVSVDSTGKSAKNRIRWDDGTEGEYFSRGIELTRAEAGVGAPQAPANVRANAALVHQVVALGGNDETESDDSSSESSLSDSEDEIQYRNREAANELDPEDGLPENFRPLNPQAQAE